MNRPEDFTEPFGGPPTRVRYGVLGLTALMSVLLYLDRVCISVAGPAISEALGLNRLEMSVVYGSFFLAYALGQIPVGWLGDRLGARAMLTVCVLTWSLLTGLTGLAPGLVALVAMRFLVGLSQAGAFPIAARVNSVWMPFSRRALASSVVTLGARAGGAVAPPLTALLMVELGGWPEAFWVYALLGVFRAVGFWCWFRPTPSEHPVCNPAEVRWIAAGRPEQVTLPGGRAGAIPWASACRSTGLWMQCLGQFASNIPWAFLITWLPTYLAEVYRVDLTQGGWLSSLPLLAGTVGCLLGGIVTDFLTRRLGLRWGRRTLGMTSKYLAAVGLIIGLLADSPLTAVLALAFMSFATDTGLSAIWAYFQDAGGRYVGTFLGWANMFGNLGAFISPLLLGWLAEECGWQVALATCAALYVLSGLTWFGVDATVPIVPEAKPIRSDAITAGIPFGKKPS